MTAYNFQSLQVDLKADNTHASAKVIPTTTTNTDLSDTTTQISAGAVVLSAANGCITVGVAGAANVVGIANQTRSVGDVRPLTYTRKGMVHAIADGSTILVGSRVKAGNQGMVALANPNGSEASLEIGKALEVPAYTVGHVIVIELTL